MKFPGQRKSKHYFPVNARDPLVAQIQQENPLARTHLVGVGQTIVDIEARVDDDFLQRHALSKGHSLVLDEDKAELLYKELKERNLISHEYPGDTIGNTLHNYSVLADDKSILLGVMSKDLKIGSYAYRYLCNTSCRMDLDYLQPVDGPIGRCYTLISEDGERTFAINEGDMNQLRPDNIPEKAFKKASALVLSSYLVRGKPNDPMKDSALKAIEYAKKYDVPVVLTLGTKYVIEDRREWWIDFLKEHVTCVAMNEEEGEALTGEKDPLLAADKALEWVDLVLCTAGPVGLYMAGYTDDELKRESSLPLLPGKIPEFNKYEFSRPMKKADCENPIRVYSHIAPYLGGPVEIKNTNGAGDAALSALLHDMSANRYHKFNVPNSAKHNGNFLSYSSFSQICQYSNRASYEVLIQHAPRLSRGLPEREDCLEEAYWER
ncbi:TPA: inosine/guanosine kinase [Photobacterium damselae]|uniref:Guanosine-inosine kinase n=3 Tax=Photobacterium damselae TaxID=38293 RepID=D0YY11_PHODD|nr:inosine/guanosine kinase [Photobacterium damselae]ARR49190.1 inosine/guanosine kinase [Photobacterium damselae subsp. damselae]AWK81989.1 inosine/guanosine kinase [Photobacterium damselae]EEZ41142.1 inosine-guanosine kinase [Photobacterium damselae subsp. damselae CIP 102761]EHA1079335.1 inosine/guanosine kinase [Photobacterium damselae]EJN6960605.1 inosine/guanosine kinase [Photobacterium damselae]